MLYSTFLPLLVALTALAHPGEQHEELSVQERHSLQSRQLQARNCQPQIARYIAARKAKRSSMRKRTLPDPVRNEGLVSRADGCVLNPEVTEGPYYINDELVRSNLIEDLSGVNATIDIQLLDLSTCEPVTNALVELWAASPQGVYSGYGSASTITKRQGPSSTGGGTGGTGGTGGSTTALTDSSSFLRGGNVVDENGNVTITTLYPGFYTGRTAHIHVMVHANYSINSNGTIDSREGQLLHIGQMFFEEEYNYMVFNTSDYQGSSNTRTYNAEDSILAGETTTGFNPYAQVELVGDDISEGVNIYQVLVVDTSASYSVTNTNFAPTFTYVSDYTSESTAISNSSNSSSGSSSNSSSSSSSRASSSSSSTSAATTATTSSSSTSNGEWTAKSGGFLGLILATLGGGLMIWWA